MDLETGRVVEEWQPGDGQKVKNFGPVEKYAQRAGEPTLFACSNNALFQIDPRVDKKQAGKKKVYAKAPKFGVMASTGAGQAAVGSDNGEIRLYSDIAKNAKTLLPGLGDEVIGIDVTENGHWILATSARYLLVLRTVLPDDKSKTGFDKSLGKNKPKPIKLQLNPTDLVKYNIEEVNFTPAHFNTGDGIQEEWIITSTGPYIITWDFKKVKEGHRFSYKIKKAASKVVADIFRYGWDDQVVVAEPNNAYVEVRKKKS